MGRTGVPGGTTKVRLHSRHLGVSPIDFLCAATVAGMRPGQPWELTAGQQMKGRAGARGRWKRGLVAAVVLLPLDMAWGDVL